MRKHLTIIFFSNRDTLSEKITLIYFYITEYKYATCKFKTK